MDEHTLIKNHEGIAFALIGRYGRWYPTKREGIKSSALLGLVQAVKWIKEGRMYNDNYAPYIHATIVGHIRYFLQHDNLVYTPRGNKPTQVFDSENIHYIARTEDHHIEESIEELCNNDLERRILELRLSNYTMEEIGDQVGKVKSYIHGILHEMGRRYESKRVYG